MNWDDFTLGFTLGCVFCSIVGTIATYREAKKRWNKNKPLMTTNDKPLEVALRKNRGLCQTRFCRNLARRGRTRCNTCRSRMYDKPLRRLFRNLKAHASARGKEFYLTFEEFEDIARESGYDVNHGRKDDCLQVDRIDARKGYMKGNIQIITTSQNAAKSWYDRKHPNYDLPPRLNRTRFSEPSSRPTC